MSRSGVPVTSSKYLPCAARSMRTPKVFRYQSRTDSRRASSAAMASGVSRPSDPMVAGACSGAGNGSGSRPRGQRRWRTPPAQSVKAASCEIIQSANFLGRTGYNPRQVTGRRFGSAPVREIRYADASSRLSLSTVISRSPFVSRHSEICRSDGRPGAVTFVTVAESDDSTSPFARVMDSVNWPCAARPVTRSSKVFPCRTPPDSRASGSRTPPGTGARLPASNWIAWASAVLPALLGPTRMVSGAISTSTRRAYPLYRSRLRRRSSTVRYMINGDEDEDLASRASAPATARAGAARRPVPAPERGRPRPVAGRRSDHSQRPLRNGRHPAVTGCVRPRSR